MKKGGTRYSPAFKFRVVLEALKAEGKGAEAQVAPACGVHPPALANGRSTSKRRSMEKRMKGRHVSSITHYSSRVTHHEFYYRSPMEYLQTRFEEGLRRWSGTWSIRTGWRE